LEGSKTLRKFQAEFLKGVRAPLDIKDPRSGEILVKKGRKITKTLLNKLSAARIESIPVKEEELLARVSSHDVEDPETGKILLRCNQEVDEKILAALRKQGVKSFKVLYFENNEASIRNTLVIDKIASPEEAIVEIYRRLRPSDPSTKEAAVNFFNNLFFRSRVSSMLCY